MHGLAEATDSNRVTIRLTNSAGRTEEFVILPLNNRLGGVIQRWINKLPKPNNVKEAIELSRDLAPLIQKDMIDRARAIDDSWPPQIMWHGPMALGAITEQEGGLEYFMAQILQRAKPNLSEREIADFVDCMTRDDTTRVMNVVFNVGFTHILSSERKFLFMLDQEGLTHLVRAASRMAGSEMPDSEIDRNTEVIASQLHTFGTVINVGVSNRGVEVPKCVAPEPQGQ